MPGYRIEIVSDDTNLVAYSIVADSFGLVYEKDGIVRTLGESNAPRRVGDYVDAKLEKLVDKALSRFNPFSRGKS